MDVRLALIVASLVVGACTGDDSGTTTSLSGGDQDAGAGADDGPLPTSGTTAATTTGSGGESTGPAGSTSDSGTTAVVDGTATGSGMSSGEPGSSSSETTAASSDAVGCADGEREGFLDLEAYTDIAGCGGGWDVPGILNTTEPSCDREAGDDALNTAGRGCTVADLCVEGWHVCASAAEVDDKSPNGCVGATEDVVFNNFFATRQSGVGNNACSAGANDFHGCGNIGAGGLDASCAPLDRTSEDLCASLAAPWSCPGSPLMEANQVVKPGAALGGVLCCRDDD